jgi:hypothetical protein
MELATRLKTECVGLLEQARLELAMRDSMEEKAELKAAEIRSLEALEFAVAPPSLDSDPEITGPGSRDSLGLSSGNSIGNSSEGVVRATASSPIAAKSLVLESNQLLDC